MNNLYHILKSIFQKRFLVIAYIVLIALTVMFVAQQQLRIDSIGANNPNEPFVNRSLYLASVEIMYPDNRTQTIFAGLKLCKRMKAMKSPEKVSFFTWVRYWEVFENGRINRIPFRATDGVYWDVMKFRFVEGLPYSEKDVAENKPLVVISETSRKRFFGNETQVVGRQIEIEGLRLTVCGVVENVPYSSTYAFGEFWMPYTAWGGKIHGDSSAYDENAVQGLYLVQTLARKRSDFAQIHREYNSLIAGLNKEMEPEMKITRAMISTRMNDFFGKNKNRDKYQFSAADIWRNYLSTLGLLLVPLLALMCLNFARANESSTEIGIRRMVGAGRLEINGELIIENAVIISIGIVLGVFLAYLTVYLYPLVFISGADAGNFEGGAWLSFTWRMLSHLLLTLVVFLAASVALPIVRVNRQSVLNLLKGDEL